MTMPTDEPKAKGSYMDGEPPHCEVCGRAVERGQFVHCYDDVGEVHVDCGKPFAIVPDVEAVDEDAGPIYILLGQPLMRYRVNRP
jgi:hypothetical protein